MRFNFVPHNWRSSKIVLLFISLLTLSFSMPCHASDNGALGEAYFLMAKAHPLYKGHRAKAMNHVKVAIHLQGAKLSGKKPKQQHNGDSDALMRAAQEILQQSRAGLKTESLDHVDEAISEISAALSGE